MKFILTSFLSLVVLSSTSLAQFSPSERPTEFEPVRDLGFLSCSGTVLGLMVFTTPVYATDRPSLASRTYDHIVIKANGLQSSQLPVNSRLTRLAKTLTRLYRNSTKTDKAIAVTGAGLAGACIYALYDLNSKKDIIENPRAALENVPAFRQLVDQEGMDGAVKIVEDLENGKLPADIIDRVVDNKIYRKSPIDPSFLAPPEDNADVSVSH